MYERFQKMKNTLILIALTTYLSSCSSLAKPLLPLKSRSLYIDSDKAVFYSTYTKCTGRVFKKCKLKRIEYDFTNKVQRLELKHSGFKLKVVK